MTLEELKRISFQRSKSWCFSHIVCLQKSLLLQTCWKHSEQKVWEEIQQRKQLMEESKSRDNAFFSGSFKFKFAQDWQCFGETITHAYITLPSLLRFYSWPLSETLYCTANAFSLIFVAFLIILIFFYWISPSLRASLLQKYGSQYSRWVFRESSTGLLSSSLFPNENISPDTTQACVWLMIFLVSCHACVLFLPSCHVPKTRWVCILKVWISSDCCFSNTCDHFDVPVQYFHLLWTGHTCHPCVIRCLLVCTIFRQHPHRVTVGLECHHHSYPHHLQTQDRQQPKLCFIAKLQLVKNKKPVMATFRFPWRI